MTANLSVKTQEALNVLKIPSAALRFWPPQDYLDKHMKEYPDSTQKMIERVQKFMARRSGQSGSGSQSGSSGQTIGSSQTAANTQSGQGGRPGSASQGQGRQGWGGQGGNMRLKMGMVWVKLGNLLIPHRVKTGISDNSYTEVEGSIKEGDELVTGIVNANSSQQTTQQQSPFAPQMGRPPTGGAGAAGRGGR
jgi:hypothetical protein